MASSCSSIHSSPSRHSSGRIGSQNHVPPPKTQEALKRELGNELQNHTWSFSAPKIASMLSSKSHVSHLGASDSPTARDVKDSLSNYDCTVDKLTDALETAYVSFDKTPFPTWNPKGNERAYYKPLKIFFSNCVKACHVGLDEDPNFTIKKEDRWHAGLHFVIYDKPTRDGVAGASAVKPDLTAGKFKNHKQKDILSWSPIIKGENPIEIPVEVKESWPELIRQAATYARCLFDASPLRQFALVLGFAHGTRQLRFLIFHRGGLTASDAFSVDTDVKDILRMFIAILTWESAADAGFPEWCNDTQFCIPLDSKDTEGVVVTVDEVLHSTTCVRGRAPRVSRASYTVESDINPGSELRASSSVMPAIPEPNTLVPTTHLRRSTRISQASNLTTPSTPKSALPDLQPFSGMEPAGVLVSDTVEEPQSPIAISRWAQRDLKFVRQPLADSASLKGDLNKTSNRRDIVIKSSWAEDNGQNIESDILEACSGQFGTPKHYVSYRACHEHQRITNHLFLPDSASKLSDYYWALFPSYPNPPSLPEYRSLCIHVIDYMGHSLVTAKTPWSLFLSLAHAMLGWLTMCQSDYQHRDISIGNLVMLDKAVKTLKFKLDRLTNTENSEWDDVEEALGEIGMDHTVDTVALFEELLNDLEISNMCTGFVIDGDMAINWKTYFLTPHDGSRSGTPEFMSNTLLDSAAYNTTTYVQSPVDDLFAFFYTGQWAAAYNNEPGQPTRSLQKVRNAIAGPALSRDSSIVSLQAIRNRKAPQSNSFLVHSARILIDWHSYLSDLQGAWECTISHAPEGLIGAEASSFYTTQFRKFSQLGVLGYLRLLCSHRGGLQNYTFPPSAAIPGHISLTDDTSEMPSSHLSGKAASPTVDHKRSAPISWETPAAKRSSSMPPPRFRGS